MPVHEDHLSLICISSGHGKLVRGASGFIDEVDEARRVVDRVVKILSRNDKDVLFFHDDTSTTQDENLKTIVDWHNSHQRDVDVSVHFNAYQETDKEMGTEVLYLTEDVLALDVCEAICDASDLFFRGPKPRDDLYFLNNTEEPAILIEVCFVDSSADVELYHDNFNAICHAIARALETWRSDQVS